MGQAQLRPELQASSESALALSDALEKLISDGNDTEEDRQAAYDLVVTLPTETAGDAFGRAAIAGRLAEKKGALALLGDHSPTALVAEAEKFALKSRKLDASFRRAAATRLLGTLYVLAPANLLEGGNSEAGIEILEGLVKVDPELISNQLRLAEAYVALGDKESARAPLCLVLGAMNGLRGDEVKLARSIERDIGDLDCPKKAPETPTGAPPGG
jgi:predicted Zn-dependent protease